ncbi:hypothetical protein GTO91_15180 [Heliobacterium undosum]|uniref:ABC-2 transporter permease n=1 Tax=Heliomicrobium undosum TaxID=121734 RepID=A0A845L364_9FIRM|nr:ABC-2 transporter permease [Heliomicrobium undosum]MZP31057.1 hypothetical protein [Heliomicrobium undosum]
MWQLVKKDFQAQKKSLRSLGLLLLGITGLILSGKAEPTLFGGIWGILTVMFTLSYTNGTILYEEKSRGYLFLRSLPLSPRQIVAAKFMGGLLSALATTLIVGILLTIAQMIYPPESLIPPFAAFIYLGVTLLFNGLVLMLSFRFGYMKAQRFFALIALSPLIFMALPKGWLKGFFYGPAMYMAAHVEATVAGFVLCVAVFLSAAFLYSIHCFQDADRLDSLLKN